MDNNVVGFIEYKGTKESLLSNTTIKDGDIVFGYDETSDISYIYHNGVFYSNTSELSEVLPEIYIGDASPLEGSSAVVWYQTNVDLPEEDIVVSWEDVENKPTFAEVAFSGSYTDLKDVPDTIKKTYYAHGQVDRAKYHLTDEQLIDNINTQKSIKNKEEANYIIHVVDTDKYYPVNKVVQEQASTQTLYAVVFADDDSNVGNNIVNPIVTSVKLNIHNGEISGGKPIGGSGDAFVDSAYLSTKGYVNSHTTTYIGTENPSTISSKYNLWVDTSKEEVVFKYKADNEWKVLSTGGNGSIEVDTLLDPTSENPIANKAVYELATVIGEDFEEISKDLSKKATTENGLVEGRGFKVPNTENKYYLPNTTTSSDPTVDDNHIIATKADTLSNEVIDSKATMYNLYAMDDLTTEQLAANEAALVSVQNREVAIYKVYTNDDTYAIADVKIVDGPYLEAYVYVTNPNTTSKQATVTKYTYTFNQAGEYMTGDKQEVIVPSLSKVEEMIKELPSGSGGRTSIPVVSSEEELGSLSQKKGDLAVVLSEDSEGMGYVPALSLRQATYADLMMAAKNGTGLPMCDSVDGVQIDSSVSIVPCTAMSNLTVAAFISGDNPRATGVLAIVMPMDADGYPSQASAVNIMTEEEYGVLATYNATTGKLEVDEQVSAIINEYISGFDAKWVCLGDADTFEPIAANAETNATFSFLKCLAQSVTLGVKSIRVKGDDGYTRFDADVVKIVSESDVKGLNSLNMPVGAMVRVYAPESVEYDSDWAALRIPANDDATSASVVNKVELSFNDNFNSNLLPHIRIIDASGDKRFDILWTADGGLKCNLIVIGLSDTAEEIVLGENSVWNEENLKRIDELLLSGINILDNVFIGSVSLYDSTTGEPDIDIIAEGGAYVTPFVTLYCNERQLPERVDVYDKLSYGWKKREEGGSGSGGGASVTVDSAMSDSSTNPVQNKVVKAYVDQAVSDVTITVDTELSSTSTNPVQNKVIYEELDRRFGEIDTLLDTINGETV